MTIIPYSEVKKQNDLRFNLIDNENKLADLILQAELIKPDFNYSDADINELKTIDSNLAECIIQQITICKNAAEMASASDYWFNDMIKSVVSKKEAIEKKRKAEENAE